MNAPVQYSLRDRLAYLVLLLVVLALPWPWGSVSEAAQGGLLALTGLGLLLSLSSAEGGRWPVGLGFRIAVAAWLLWLLWLCLSLLPLPLSWLQRLSPSAVALHDGVRLLGLTPRYTLSTEPGATWHYLIATLGLFGLYLLAARTVCDNPRRKGLLAVMALTAGVQAFYGLGMTLTDTEIGYLVRKTYGRGSATGTFVNRNHFAHLLALGAVAALGLLLAQRASDEIRQGWRGVFLRVSAWIMSPAAVWRVLLLVMLAAVVLSQSRMGNVALMVALVFAVLLWVLLHNRRRFVPALLLLASFAIADIWILDNYYGLEKVVERIDDTELETEQRTLAWQDLQPLVGQYLRTGSGGGSFQSLFMGVQSPQLYGLYDHAHNEYAEFLIEHGLFGLVWLLAMGLLHFRHAVWLLIGRRSGGARALGIAAAAALVAVALHSLTDFVLHIPALRGWLAVLMGALMAAGLRHRRDARKPGRMRHNADTDLIPTAPVA